MAEEARSSFVKGAAILAAAAFISRFIGLFYRVVLTRAIGAEGVGLYQMAYPLYTFLLVFSVSGIPIALAKIVSEKIALGKKMEAFRVFQIALKLSTGFGVVFSLFLILFAKPLIALFHLDPRGYYTIIAIAPAIFVVSIMAVYRGFFQGMQNMVPTAISQIIEQIIRMVTIVGLAYLFLPFGIPMAAAGATFSAGTGAIAGVIVMFYYWVRHKKLISAMKTEGSISTEPTRLIVRRLAAYAIPVVVAASIVQLMNMIILVVVPRQLQVIGFSVEQATALYGELTTALVLVQFPNIITTSLQTSLIPSISGAFALGHLDNIRNQTKTALRLSFMLALPCSVGLYVLAEPLCSIIFGLPSVAITLRVLAWSNIFIFLQQTSSGVLQGTGKVKSPATNLLIGALFNGVMCYFLTAVPAFGIRGAAWGTVMGFAAAAILNLLAVWRVVRFNIDLSSMVIKPVIAVAAMGVIVNGVYWGFMSLLKLILPFGVKAFATMFAVGAGVVTFFAVLLMLGGLTTQDLRLVPGMGRFIPVLQKMNLLKG